MTSAPNRVKQLALAAWLFLSLLVIAIFIFSPAWLSGGHTMGQRLGPDIPLQLLIEPAGQSGQELTPEAVAALPDEAFTSLHQALNKGYTRQVHWLRWAPVAPATSGRLWLEILPTYLDQVTLYQPVQGQWQAQRGGDTVPMTQRITQHLALRQPMFALLPDQPAVLRVQTTSPMQVEGTVWRTRALMEHLAHDEWASGMHIGLNLLHALLLLGAALALRQRALFSVSVAAWVTWIHGASDRGYWLLWLPEALESWADVAVSVGTLVLPMALSWQFHENLTKNTRWRVADRLLLIFGVVPLLALVSIPLGYYPDWAWTGIVAPWLIGATSAVVSVLKLRHEGPNPITLAWLLPGGLAILFGGYVISTYLGLIPLLNIETSVLWQTNLLMGNLTVTIAVGLQLTRKYRNAVAQLAQSEASLEARVHQRTTELQNTQHQLNVALQRERQALEDQRRFFQMVSHEFRTPLAIMDSAATEQLSFPSTEIGPQVARATQIRRASRRLASLVDNYLTQERLLGQALQLRCVQTDLHALVREASQSVLWSRKHTLQLELDDLPERWPCDPMLLRIALSNLVDNAVKYAPAGIIIVRAERPSDQALHLIVSDPGPPLPPDETEPLFQRGARGQHAASGFGLGLWLCQHIARLHGGDVLAGTGAPTPALSERNCFTLRLPARPPCGD